MTSGAHYTVLARRFRPQAFDDVVGQQHVALALRNAIRSERVAHAYLFTGARGVGKTSTARILAKALNCPDVQDGVPCNKCEICEGISAGNDVDVSEIDGASNRGIDDIRALRANIGVRSMRTKYKVYIIDEVHALSRDAFNALLKTLEEPPPNVKFVFCTTEPNKVPDTILSRCQRFDFSAIGEESISQRLGEIARIEGFEVSDDALELVARRARGSMRDSQSLFDQLLAFSDGQVSAEDVHRMLGTADDDRLAELFTAIVEHRPGEVLSLLDSSLESGVQAGELMDQAIGYVRDLMVVQSGGKSVPLSSVSDRFREILTTQAASLGMHSIMAAFQILADARSQMFRSTFGRTLLEMALVQLSLLENLTALSDLLSGRLPQLPVLSNTSGAAGTTAAEPAPPSAAEDARSTEKKNDNAASRFDVSAEATGNSAQPDVRAMESVQTMLPEAVSATQSATITKSAETLELSEANLPLLLNLLADRLGFTIGGGLKKTVGATLPSPGRLEVLLEFGNEFVRKALEKPEHRAAIETEVRRLTGRDISFSVRVATPRTESDGTTESPSSNVGDVGGSETTSSPADRSKDKPSGAPAGSDTQSSGRKTRSRGDSERKPVPAPVIDLTSAVDPQKDPFVRHVVSIFGAKVARIIPAPNADPGSESQDADT